MKHPVLWYTEYHIIEENRTNVLNACCREGYYGLQERDYANVKGD